MNLNPRLDYRASLVLLGVAVLFIAYACGAFVGDRLIPGGLSPGPESFGSRVGASVAILVAAVLLRRYVLRSLRPTLMCLAVAESVALLLLFVAMDYSLVFAGVYLLLFTWNVVAAFLAGSLAAELWDRRR